jgi:acetyl-CoA/propionyl-CoA carboxylase biotin carboxyl carrier protein
MLAKLIVWGPDRATALARSRRALDEYAVEGVSTLLPLHRSLVDAPDFAGEQLRTTTRWLEEDFMPAWAADRAPVPSEDAGEPAEQVEVVVEVDGHRLVVSVPAELAAPAARPQRSRRVTRRSARAAAATGTLTAPMQGTIVAVDVAPGDRVAAGDRLAVIEAMKMEQPLTAAHDAVVRAVTVGPGAGVRSGDVLVEFEA